MSLRVAALVKQIPAFEEMRLGADGRLRREGVALEMSAYCRRAVAQAVALVADHGGEVVVCTLGPRSAEDTLREAIAWATDRDVTARGVLVSDPAFAGSDTLATATSLATTLEREGPFDLVLTGRASLDADTGQVGPQVAQLLDLPFATGVRHLAVSHDHEIDARCEHDDGWVELHTSLPAVLSCAERLIDPCKVEPTAREAVPEARITRRSAAELGPGPWGGAASPTSVGRIQVHEVDRARRVLRGPLPDQVAEAVAALAARGALRTDGHTPAEALAPSEGTRGRAVAVVVEPARERLTRELLGGAARLAGEIGGHVVAFGTDVAARLGAHGADALVTLDPSPQGGADLVEEDVARALTTWAEDARPWAVLAPGTAWGREVAARFAAAGGHGLVGDAVALETDGERLLAWKPAFGGSLVAEITASSPVQVATVRAGVLDEPSPRPPSTPTADRRSVRPRGRIDVLRRTRDDDLDVLADADAVVGVGQGVPPEAYRSLEGLLRVLGAELGATRKVTDHGWLPHARQIGITGRSIAPRLYVALGLGGKFNHMVGVRAAGTVLAVNDDPEAPVFDAADVGIVGDWSAVVPLLTAALEDAAADGVAGSATA